ncbi:hypothetical protein GGR51DRAFT_534437 [Nemania sp. FL0031]|nr:hypothetical protein GGR51DRAFT_534437 [Nemania sp. FL0031]
MFRIGGVLEMIVLPLSNPCALSSRDTFTISSCNTRRRITAHTHERKPLRFVHRAFLPLSIAVESHIMGWCI